MAAYHITEIQSVQPQGPYLLGGHSFGGKVAFEMAQQLQKQGHEITLVAILETNAPEPVNKFRELDWDDTRWLVVLGNLLGYLFNQELGLSYDLLKELMPEQQYDYILEQLRRIGFFPPGAGLQQLRSYFQIFKANCLSSYFPQKIYPTPIAFFQSRDQTPSFDNNETNTEHLLYENMSEPDWGWGQFADGPVEVYTIPGDHVSMLREPHVQVLAEQLKVCFDRPHS